MGRICMTKIIEEITNLFAGKGIPVFGMMSASSLENEPLGCRSPDIPFNRDPVIAPYTFLLAKNGGEEWAWWERP
jgi:hypothetical protein